MRTAAYRRVGDQPQTARARRSAISRLAPPVVLALGVFFVVVAVERFNTIYDGDPGIFRASQVAPRPVAFGHSVLLPMLEDLEDRFARSRSGRSVCRQISLGGFCRRHPSRPSNAIRKKELERYAGRVFGHRAADVSLTSWEERPDRVVAVAVAKYGTDRAARAALAAAGGQRRSFIRGTVFGRPTARTAWLEGKRLLVGVVVSAARPGAAARQLVKSRRQVRTYVTISRATWYEAIALGPLVLLLLALASARLIVGLVAATAVLVATLAFLLFAVAGVVILLVSLLVWIPIRMLSGRRRPHAVTAQQLDRPQIRVVELDETINRLEAQSRSAVFGVVGLVGFGIATLTTSLLPASLVWGSLIVVALFAPRKSARTNGSDSW